MSRVRSKRRKGRTCPACGGPAGGSAEAEGSGPPGARAAAPSYWPFCSRRCADRDLARWLDGAYRIETEEPPEFDHPDALPLGGPVGRA